MINRVSAFAGNQHPVHFARKATPVQKPVFGAAARTTKADPVPVTVAGRGWVERMPDTMQVSLALHETADTRKKVNEALNLNSKKLLDAIDALKLPSSVKVSSFLGPVNAQYEWERTGQGNKQVIKGYQGNFYVNVVERNDKPEEFGDHAAALKNVADTFETSGGTFSGPTYSLTNDSEARLEALKKAVQDAKTKADTVAGALNQQLEDRPLSVDVGAISSVGYNAGGGNRMAMAASLESMDSAGGAPQASGDSFRASPIRVGSDNVQISFSLKA